MVDSLPLVSFVDMDHPELGLTSCLPMVLFALLLYADERLPLAIGAFLCAYGFALTCSPRSPISNFSGSVPPSTKLSWMHLPIPHSAWLMNTFVIGVTLVAFVFNTTVHSINVVMRNRAHRPGHDFSGEVLQQHHTQEWRDQIPTTAMLAFARVGWSDLLNVYRFCSMAYLSFTAMISLIVLILLLYAVPNQIFLINHVCDIYPGPLPANCVKDGGFFSNLRLLYRLGLPRNLHGSKYHAFKKMWMVTMVGHSQAVWLINGAALFLFIPAYLATSPWRKLMQGKSLRNTIDLAFGWVITVAFITAFWITTLSATMTLDDIFRAVSGMGEVKPETRANDQETAVNSEVRSHVQLVSADSNNGEKRVATRTISFLGDRMGVRQEPTFSGSSATLTDEKQNITTSDHSANHTGIRVTIVKETIVS